LWYDPARREWGHTGPERSLRCCRKIAINLGVQKHSLVKARLCQSHGLASCHVFVTALLDSCHVFVTALLDSCHVFVTALLDSCHVFVTALLDSCRVWITAHHWELPKTYCGRQGTAVYCFYQEIN